MEQSLGKDKSQESFETEFKSNTTATTMESTAITCNDHNLKNGFHDGNMNETSSNTNGIKGCVNGVHPNKTEDSNNNFHSTNDINGGVKNAGLNNSVGVCPITGATADNGGGISSVQSKSTRKPFVLKNLLDGSQMVDTLHHQAHSNVPCSEKQCSGSIYMPAKDEVAPGELRAIADLKAEATRFLREYYSSLKSENSENHQNRLNQVMDEIDRTQTYELEEKELTFGARTAWRNAPRCNGRIQWKKLQIFDCRHVTTAREMFDCLLRHIQYATNKGNLRSTISIFPHKKNRMSEFRLWNPQLVRYAGYKQSDGSVIGDPVSIEFTEICESLGWKGARTQFDVLPLILSAPGCQPELFEIPKEMVLEVDIKHQQYPGIEKLGLKWYALPAVANMMLDCGGLQFTAAPFNGWYNATEIGARNFTDTCRYNLMKPVAEVCGFDTSNVATLWKDKVAVELTFAVIHSFQQQGVTIADHHTSAESFMKHLKDEEKVRGGCPTDWVWVVPPISGGIMPMFHQEFLNYCIRPSYEYQPDPWRYLPVAKKNKEFKESQGKKKTFKNIVNAVKFSSSLMKKAMVKRFKTTILYASETGKSEKFAHTLNEVFLFAFDSKVVCMEEYDFKKLSQEQCVIIVTSTFGNGESPDNGMSFHEGLQAMLRYGKNDSESDKNLDIITNVRFTVFGLGSRAYPHFCSFAHDLNNLLSELGGEEIYTIGKGDELCGQEESFNLWAANAFKAACGVFGIYDVDFNAAVSSINTSIKDWKKGLFRLVKTNAEKENISRSLGTLHRKKVVATECMSVANLQSPDSERVTDLVKIDRLGHEEINYRPGDHLSVFPSNEKQLVDALLNRVQSDIEPDQPVLFEHKECNKWIDSFKFQFPTTLRRMMTSYLDITSPPSTKLISIFVEQAVNDYEKEELKKLSVDQDAYENWVHKDYPNIIEVLEKYPSVVCDVTILVNHLPLLNPRHYSISSSQDLHPAEVHATVALVSYQVNGTTHNGVCSNYLHTLKPGETVYCCIRKAPSFHLPENKLSPVIMIGPGTGVAPFRSFWQQAAFEHRTLNDSAIKRELTLYFGCRNLLDDIYQTETEEAKLNGIIKNVNTAYSRVQNQPKTYVQHLLQRDMEEIGEHILSKGGHIYVCGDVTMASDVYKTLTNVLQEYAAFSDAEAKQCMSALKRENRYHEDIFGVTLKVKEVTDKVRKGAKRLKRQTTLPASLTHLTGKNKIC